VPTDENQVWMKIQTCQLPVSLLTRILRGYVQV
jgi:hypothetical protein